MRMDSDADLRWQALLLGVVFEGGMALLALFLGWLLGQPALETFHWSLAAVAVGAVASVPMLALFLGIERWPVGPLARIRRFLDETIVPLFGRCSLVELALISLLAGVGEEMLFRGVIQAATSRWLGWAAALLIASALFGLLHPITRTYIVLAAALGAYLGGVWLLSGNLLTVIVTHALYDFVVLVYLLRRPRTSIS
jgi:membrane protease YdiL (CAAX protease family)